MATAVQTHISASLYLSIGVNSPQIHALPHLPISNISRISTSFTRGSPLVRRPTSQRKADTRAASISIKCEQGTKEGGGSGVDVWLGRFAMIGFAAAIGTEVTTGKGVLENFGLTSPLPTVALAVAGLVGVLTAIFIFQSASNE